MTLEELTAAYLPLAGDGRLTGARWHRGQELPPPRRIFSEETARLPPPRGWQPARVCALTGHRATDACDQVFLEWFRPGEVPVDDCQVHQRRAIDRRTGLLATTDTPRSEIEVRTFTELPPRYAAWQAAVALPRPPETVSAFRPGMMSPGTGATYAVLDPSRPARLYITSPENGVRLLRDPETPADLSTVALILLCQTNSGTGLAS